jgi:hypothetical protein
VAEQGREGGGDALLHVEEGSCGEGMVDGGQ